MMARCYNPNLKNYHHYGGRGIKVCESWRLDSESFVRWALDNGYDKELSIDRIDNDGNYSPDNCRWTTRRIQNINKKPSTPSKTGYIGISVHSSSYGDNIYYYGRVRNKEGKAIYTGMSKDILQAVIMRNNYIIENGLKNELNSIPISEVSTYDK